MKLSAGFQALPAGGAADVAGCGSGKAGVPEGEGIVSNGLARAVIGILVTPKDDDLADREVLLLVDDVGDSKAGGAADAKGVGDGTGVSCCAVRTLSTEPPLANSRLEATTFTSPDSFAGISTAPLLCPALTKTVDVSILPLGDLPCT
jgi:hypothetical protein